MPVTAGVTAVVVGPCGVRASSGSAAECDLVAAALDGIDDDFMLVDEQPVAVGSLWREVFTALLDGEAATLICPTWWPDRRIATVFDATRTVAARAEVVRRCAALASAVPSPPGVVIEIAAAFVAMTWRPAARPTRIEPREADLDGVADEVARFAAGSGSVVVDCADGVAGARE
ncbi:MAG: type VII secretion-associated protein, partial [Mycobacterium sp.]